MKWILSERRTEMGVQAREFVLNNYSIEVVGKFFEDLFDELPLIDWSQIDLTPKPAREKKSGLYSRLKSLDNSKWLLDIYKNILNMDIDENDNGYKYWMNEFVKGKSREVILNFFTHTARKENAEVFKKNLKEEVRP